MNPSESASQLGAVHQALASTVAHCIERLSKEEIQDLADKVNVALQTENAGLRKQLQQAVADADQYRHTIAQLEEDKARLQYQISRSFFSEKDWENFDPSQFTVPIEEILADMEKVEE